MFSRSALYLLVVLVTVLLALMVYIVVDVFAADHTISPQQRTPRGPLDPGRPAGETPGAWLFDAADADARPGLSQAGERWNR